jgi:secreted trypsin-like serine protease
VSGPRRLLAAAVVLVAAVALWVPGFRGEDQAAPGPIPGVVALINASSPVDAIYHAQFCGGVVIGRRLVLTAAHCVATRTAGSIDVVIGADNLCRNHPIDGVRLPVVGIDVHPDYDATSARFDLALLTLAADAPDGSIRKVGGAPTEGGSAITAGWGSGPGGGAPPCRLRSLRLTLLPPSECAERVGADDRPFDPRSMLCAVPDPPPAEATCAGDSGGPLILGDDPNSGAVVGVVSWGRGCGSGAPGVYARDESWIESWLRGAP